MEAFDSTTASRAVLIEVVNVLGAFRGELVVVGGWVPDLLFPNRGHIGSLDVDLALSAGALADNAYQTILRRLTDAGYTHQAAPGRFVKVVPGVPDPVKVDLIAGEYQAGEQVPSIRLNDLRVNTLRGIDLAFAARDEIELSGATPDRALNTVRVRMVLPEAFILLKAFALDERVKEKDAYDIAFVLRNHSSLAALAERVGALLSNRLALDAYQILREKFAAIDAVGPVWAARVAAGQGADYEQHRRAAFEDAQDLFRWVEAIQAKD